MAQLTLRYGFPGGIWLSQSLKRDWTLSEKGDLKYERDMRGFLLLLKIGGHMASDCGWLAHKNCFRAEYNPSWHSARRGSPHSYSCKELNSPNLNEIGSGILYLPSPVPPIPAPAKLLSLASALISVIPPAGNPAMPYPDFWFTEPRADE